MAKKHTSRKKKNQVPWHDDLDINKEFFKVIVYHFEKIPPPLLLNALKTVFFSGVTWSHEMWYKAVTMEHDDLQKALDAFVRIIDTQIKKFQHTKNKAEQPNEDNPE